MDWGYDTKGSRGLLERLAGVRAAGGMLSGLSDRAPRGGSVGAPLSMAHARICPAHAQICQEALT